MPLPGFRFASITAVALIPLLVLAEEKVDLSVVNRIRTEAFSNSKVMDTMFYLTDVHGPRLTNSPNYRAAGDWAVSRLKEYGLVNVREEKWGPLVATGKTNITRGTWSNRSSPL
jgi:carboxypeptidase Q